MNGSSEEVNNKEAYNIVTTIVHPGSPSTTNANRNNEVENANLAKGQTNNAFPLDLLQPPTPQWLPTLFIVVILKIITLHETILSLCIIVIIIVLYFDRPSSVKVPCDSDGLKLSAQTDGLNSKTCVRTAQSLITMNVPGNGNNEAKCCERKSSAPIAAVCSKVCCINAREGTNDKQSSANSSHKSTPRINLLKNKVAPVSTENISMQNKTTGLKENEADAQIEGNRAVSTTSFDSLADVCRICHDNPTKLQLMTPCRCKGSMGMVHLSCLERWLSESGKNTCEICGYEYNTTRRPKYTGLNAICAWIRKPLSQNDIRNLFFDIACFFILTPLAAISAWLCVHGAQQYSIDHHFYNNGNVVSANEPSNSTWTAIGLLSLTGTLFVAYTVWLFIAARYHTNVWREWQSRNYVVTIIPFDEQEQNVVAIQTSGEDSNEALHQPNGTTNVNSHATGQDSLMAPAQDSNNNRNLCQLSWRSSGSTSFYDNTSDDELVFASVYQRDSMQKIMGSCSNLPEIYNYMTHASGGSHCNNNQEDLVSVMNVDSITTNTVLLVSNGQENTTVGPISESTTESSNSSAETDN